MLQDPGAVEQMSQSRGGKNVFRATDEHHLGRHEYADEVLPVD